MKLDASGRWMVNVSRPFTGAWIETAMTWASPIIKGGRPFTGAWIETRKAASKTPATRSPLHGGVD